MANYSTAEPIPYDERGDYAGRDWPWWKDVARVATMGAYHPGDRDISRENDKVLAANTALKIEQGKADAEFARMEKTLRDIGTPEEVINTVKSEHYKVSKALADEALNKKNMALDAGRAERAGDLGRAETDKGIAEADAGKGEGELRGRFAKARLGSNTPEITAQTEQNQALDAQKKADMERARATWEFEDQALNRGTAEAAGLPVETARTVAELQKLANAQKLDTAKQARRMTTIGDTALTDDERRKLMRQSAINAGGVTLGAGSMRVNGLGEQLVNPINYGVVDTGMDEFGNVTRRTPVRGTPIVAPPMSLSPSTASPAPVMPAPGGPVSTLTPAELEAARNARRFAPRQ
jgi:hypothetical protein